MTEGLDFLEFGKWNCFAPMVFHSDIVKFIISRPMVHPVGTHMHYNSGCSYISICYIAASYEYENKRIRQSLFFSTLGIQLYLVLKKGVYNKQRIVSEDWINHSIKPNLTTYEKIGYYGMHK